MTSQIARVGVFVSIVLLVLGYTPAAAYPFPVRTSIVVSATLADPAAQDWAVRTARVSDNFQNFWTGIEMQNISSHVIRNARFYVDFLDRTHKVCFSSAYDIRKNAQGLQEPIAPGESRELLSLSFGLGTVAEPAEARVHLIEQESEDGGKLTGGGDARFSISITISGGVPAAWLKLRLGRSVTAGKPAVIDLLLAELVVDEKGELQEMHILNAGDNQVKLWFTEAVRELVFLPSAIRGVRRTSRTLLLIRAVDYENERDLSRSTFLARDSPWLHGFMSGFSGPELPVVNQILFAPIGQVLPPAGRRDPKGETFEYATAGSEWSANVYSWTGRGSSCCRSSWKSAERDRPSSKPPNR